MIALLIISPSQLVVLILTLFFMIVFLIIQSPSQLGVFIIYPSLLVVLKLQSFVLDFFKNLFSLLSFYLFLNRIAAFK